MEIEKQTRYQSSLYTGVKLSQSGSLLLDCIRFLAALAVLAHHLTDSRLSSGFIHLGTLGYHAVCVFFVLSGFVIRFITVTRPGSVREYVADRASRIYSVVLPAIAFTILCELMARAVNPAFYAALKDNFAWRDIPFQVLANVTFLSQCWGYSVSVLTNDPFWSLSYEVIYYVAYGLLFYRVRGRWVWTALLMLIAGPTIAVLGLTWLLGAVAADAYLWLREKQTSLKHVWMAVAAELAMFALMSRPLLRWIHSVDHGERVTWMTRTAMGWGFLPARITSQPVPWIAQISPSFGVLALLTAPLMVALILTLDRVHPELPARLTTSMRWVANSTFTLYLFHVPAMLLAVVLLGHAIFSEVQGVELAFGVVLGCSLLSVYLDRLKNVMRSGIRAWFRARDGREMAVVRAS